MNRPKLTSRDDSGIRKLAGAVLLQAIEDLNEGDAEVRAETWRWLSGENEAGMSFALCCRLLGQSADAVRHGMLPYRGAQPAVLSRRAPAARMARLAS